MISSFKSHFLKTGITAQRYFSVMVIARNLPTEWTGADIVGNFNDRKVTKINFIKNKNGEKTGKAILHYNNKNDANESIKLNSGKKIFNSKLMLQLYSQNYKADKFVDKPYSGKGFQGLLYRRIYIQNMAPETTKDDIYALTRNLSDVQEIKFPKTETGQNKGFCIVYLNEADQVANAINTLHGKDVFGKKLHVSKKLEPLESTEESRLSDKLEYVKYLKRKFLANSRDSSPPLEHAPSLQLAIDDKVSTAASKREKEKTIHKLMSLDDQTLERITELTILEYKRVMFG